MTLLYVNERVREFSDDKLRELTFVQKADVLELKGKIGINADSQFHFVPSPNHLCPV